MIRIPDRVWEAWRVVDAGDGEPALELVFGCSLDVGLAAEVMRDAVSEAVAAFEAAHPEVEGVDDARPGYWRVVETPAGVVLRVDEEPDDFEWMLYRIAAGMQAAGVAGEFDVAEAAEPAPDLVELDDARTRADLFECSVRVRGTPGERQGFPFGLDADREAFDVLLGRAVEWCREPAAGLPLLQVGLSTVPLRAGDDILAAVRAGVRATESLGVVRLWTATPDGFCGVGLDVSQSRITLVDGGPASAGDWQGVVGSLRRWLVAAGDQAAYAYIKRGRIPFYAIFARSLEHDWVWREAIKVNQLVEIALEPRYAPDAFGIQLLGPGYANRIPTAADWKVTPLDGGSVLIEHTHPAAWYAKMFQTASIHVSADKQTVPPTPTVVAQARRDLTGIILTEKIVYPSGRPNPPGH